MSDPKHPGCNSWIIECFKCCHRVLSEFGSDESWTVKLPVFDGGIPSFILRDAPFIASSQLFLFNFIFHLQQIGWRSYRLSDYNLVLGSTNYLSSESVWELGGGTFNYYPWRDSIFQLCYLCKWPQFILNTGLILNLFRPLTPQLGSKS